MRKPIQYRQGNASSREAHRTASSQAAATTATATPAAPTATLSFARDIAPIFAPFAAAMMWRFDLTDYWAVTANAQTIAGRIAQGGGMPPAPFPPLSDAQIQLFQAWMAAGCAP